MPAKSVKSIASPDMKQFEVTADGTPILRGTIVTVSWGPDEKTPEREQLSGQLRIQCPFCPKRRGKPAFHLHGWNLKHGPQVLQHRVAHCAPGNQVRSGYYIAIDPEGEHVREPGVAVYRPAIKRSRIVAGGNS